jgi:hypothetical protein
MLIQLAIDDPAYRAALKEQLAKQANWEISCVDHPDMALPGVVVIDRQHLDRLPSPLVGAERVVLITKRTPEELAKAWESGVASVVYENEPLGTAVLAIHSARLRCVKPPPA